MLIKSILMFGKKKVACVCKMISNGLSKYSYQNDNGDFRLTRIRIF